MTNIETKQDRINRLSLAYDGVINAMYDIVIMESFGKVFIDDEIAILKNLSASAKVLKQLLIHAKDEATE